ncbi:MAG: hypothetical protein QOF12_2124 [Solirubrobacteraceae bacterium]|nr:hypothetical protein [Solirubrobacteraceae bacterium]
MSGRTERGDAPAGPGLPAAPAGEPPAHDPVAQPAGPLTAPAPGSRATVDALAAFIVDEAGPPIDVWAIAALLESAGVRDRDAVEGYGQRDVFALARAVQQRLPDAEPRVAQPEPIPPLRARLERYARIYGRGTFFFLPLALQLFSLLVVGISQFAAIHFTNTQASVVAVATSLSFVATSGFIQALGYLAPIYIESGKHVLARSVAWRVMGLGALAALAVGAIAFGLAAATHAYPAHELRVGAAYYLLLTAQGLVGALLYMLRRFVLILAATFVALVVVGILYKHTSLKVEQINWIGLGVGVVVQLGVAVIVLDRRAGGTRGDMRLARLPRARLLVRRALPFGVYGLVYFTFLTADRIIAWASGSNPLPLWFRAPYEVGLDVALAGIVFALAFLEITVENFSAMLVPTAERFGVDAVNEFNRVVSRFWARQLAFVGALAALGTLAATAVLVVLNHLGALGPIHKLYEDPVAHRVFGLGVLAYAFLAVGIANSVFLLSLNRPWRAIASITPGLLISITVGIVLTTGHAYWTAVIGVLAGSIVFAALSGGQAWRTLRRADYHNYAAW